MSKRTKAGSGGQTPEKVVEAEPVESERASTRGADPEAEDAAILSETAPEPAEAQADEEASQEDSAPSEDAPLSAAADESPSEPTPEQGDAFDTDREDDARPEEERAAPFWAQLGAAGGGTSGLAYGVVGAIVGGVLVLLGGEALRPETLPVDQIATKQAVEEAVEAADARFAAKIEQLSNELTAKTAEAAKKLDGVGERLALLDDREKRAADQAATDLAERSAEIAALQKELALERTRVGRLNDELAAREKERVAAVSAIREQVSALAAAVAATPSGVIGDAGSGSGSGGDGAVGAASSTRLALLEGGLRRLEARLNGLSSDALPTPDLSRIDTLEAEARAAEKSRLALETRLMRVERASRGAVAGGAALGVAFASLSEAVTGAEPYKESLKLVAELAPPGSKIDEKLWASADQGLPSYGALTEWLEKDSWTALDASAKARLRKGEGGMLDRLSGIFTFRPAVEPGDASDDEAAVLDRAQRRIKARDAAGALEEVAKLPEAAQQALAGWRAEAARRAEAEAALESLRGQLLGGSAKAAEAG